MSQESFLARIKRLRVFAGPNGSGKSTLVENIRKNYDLGVLVNADDICEQLKTTGKLELGDFRLSTNQSAFLQFCQLPASKSFTSKIGKPAFVVENNCCIVAQDYSCDLSYAAAIIASFIRHQLWRAGLSFSYETVMSHPSKIDEIAVARKLGYRIYLYYVCLDSSEINVNRVRARVKMGGHDVEQCKIESRYTSSLENLLPVLQLSHRAYLFDNSSSMDMVASFDENHLTLHGEGQMPDWFSRYVLEKLVDDDD